MRILNRTDKRRSNKTTALARLNRMFKFEDREDYPIHQCAKKLIFNRKRLNYDQYLFLRLYFKLSDECVARCLQVSVKTAQEWEDPAFFTPIPRDLCVRFRFLLAFFLNLNKAEFYDHLNYACKNFSQIDVSAFLPSLKKQSIRLTKYEDLIKTGMQL